MNVDRWLMDDDDDDSNNNDDGWVNNDADIIAALVACAF